MAVPIQIQTSKQYNSSPIISSYFEFITMVGGMAKTKYREDPLFIYNGDIYDSVVSYSKKKKVEYLYYEITVKYPPFPLVVRKSPDSWCINRRPFQLIGECVLM